MNKEDLLKKIQKEFEGVKLNKDYILPEEDHADTSRWYFDEKQVDYNLTENEWIQQEIDNIKKSNWFLEDKIEAIKAIQEKRKMVNRYKSPINIPLNYLEKYYCGFYFVKTEAYLFYTPSMMIHSLCDAEVVGSFSFAAWIGRLSWGDTKELLKHFNPRQFRILIEFLEYVINVSMTPEIEFESIVEKEQLEASLQKLKKIGLVMNTEILIEEIKKEFKAISLGECYTLLEEHYAYMNHQYFNEMGSDSISEKEKINVVLKDDQAEALKAIQGKQKILNRYPNPIAIPFIYLEHYYTGFTQLKSEAYLFYTPSMMLHTISSKDVLHSLSFQSWLYHLSESDNKKLLQSFSKKQIDILIDFLLYIDSLNSNDIEPNEIKKCLMNIQILKSHGKDTLLKKVKQSFKDVTLGEVYTLVEEDYADTSHWHFDEKIINSKLTEVEWIRQEIDNIKKSSFFLEDKTEAMRAIQEKRKMVNRYSNPLEIPTNYLNKYATGFSFLQPQAYLFYTPSIMIHALNNIDELHSNGSYSWLCKLSWSHTDKAFLKCFSQSQIEDLIDFLRYVAHLCIGDNIKSIVLSCLDKIKALHIN